MTNEVLEVNSRVEPFARYGPHLPVGTEVRAHRNARSWWVKVDNEAWWFRNDRENGYYTTEQMGYDGNHLLIRKFPDGVERVEVPSPTLEQVKWDFKVGAKAAMQSHGYQGSRDVEAALLEMVNVDLPVGPGVRIPFHDTEVPDGTVLYSGDPNDPAKLNVRVKHNGGYERILGGNTRDKPTATIASMPGVTETPDWLTREPTEDEAAQIAEFKARTWRIGWRLKRSMGWCDTYDRIMNGLGVTEEDLRKVPINGRWALGVDLEPHEVRELPVGCLLLWRHSRDRSIWSLFKRDTGYASINQAGTRRVCGTDASPPTHNYRSRMRLVAVPDEDPSSFARGWPVPEAHRPHLLPLLPPGTVFGYNGTLYLICRDGRAAPWTAAFEDDLPERGNYNLPETFIYSPITVVRVP